MRTAAGIPGLLLLSVLIAGPASAFKPNEAGHLGITSDSLTTITRTVGAETLSFSDHALREIRDANRNVDIVTFFGVEQHFDDEAFHDGSTRLIDLKESVITRIIATPPDGELARNDLGGALHTVQDFYSHSNWVELGTQAIDTDLGRTTFDALPGGVATCPSSPGTLGGAGLTSTTTGYFPFPDPCAGPPDTPAGKCRHGLEFFCPEGLNKDAPGRTGFPSARSLAVSATTDYVNQILDDPRVAGNAEAIRALMAAGVPSGSLLKVATGLESRGLEYTAPVDSTITRVTFALTIGSRNQVDVLRPSGALVSAGDPGVTITSTSGGRSIAVDSPEPGLWRVRLSGKGNFALDVAGVSPLQLDRFDLVTLGGRLGHFGFGTVSAEPVKGSKATALADLIGSYGSASFQLVSTKGKTLQTIRLFSGNADAAATDFIGQFTVPTQPFRAAVSGSDAAGIAYQRVFPRLYQPGK